MREMRRKRQQLSREDCLRILDRGTSGVLAVLGDAGYPYAVPLSYVCCGDKLYFHCAKSGHKLDAIRACDKVSFCVIDQDQVVSWEYTTYFRSVIVFGRARIMEETEKRAAIQRLAAKYSPQESQGLEQEIDRELDRLCMVELAIEHMTGKEAIELVQARQEAHE